MKLSVNQWSTIEYDLEPAEIAALMRFYQNELPPEDKRKAFSLLGVLDVLAQRALMGAFREMIQKGRSLEEKEKTVTDRGLEIGRPEGWAPAAETAFPWGPAYMQDGSSGKVA